MATESVALLCFVLVILAAFAGFVGGRHSLRQRLKELEDSRTTLAAQTLQFQSALNSTQSRCTEINQELMIAYECLLVRESREVSLTATIEALQTRLAEHKPTGRKDPRDPTMRLWAVPNHMDARARAS